MKGCCGKKKKPIENKNPSQVKPGTVVVTQPSQTVVPVIATQQVVTQQVIPSSTIRSKLIDKNL